VLDRGTGRARALVGREEAGQRLLDLPIGIEGHAALPVIDQAHRQRIPQLAAIGLAPDAALQPQSQQVELRLAHRALQPEDQSIIEMIWIIESVLVQDQRVGQGTELQEVMPVAAIAGQPRDLQPQDDPGVTQADLGHQPLEALAVRGRGPGLPLVAVDDDDLLGRPSQRHGPLAQRVLPLGALGILEDLAERGLPHVEVSVASQVAGGDSLASLGHRCPSVVGRAAEIMSARMTTICRRRSWGAPGGSVRPGGA
jgi:hypothetical protein